MEAGRHELFGLYLQHWRGFGWEQPPPDDGANYNHRALYPHVHHHRDFCSTGEISGLLKPSCQQKQLKQQERSVFPSCFSFLSSSPSFQAFALGGGGYTLA